MNHVLKHPPRPNAVQRVPLFDTHTCHLPYPYTFFPSPPLPPPPPLATVLQGNDTTFGEKLRKEAGWHPRFSFDARAPGTDFCIHHSSGSVVYSCAAMLDKNRDTLSQGE